MDKRSKNSPKFWAAKLSFTPNLGYKRIVAKDSDQLSKVEVLRKLVVYFKFIRNKNTKEFFDFKEDAMIGTHTYTRIFPTPCDKEIPQIYYEQQILGRR